MNPTVVMTDMGRLGWSDPKKAGPMRDRIPLGKFAGKESFFYNLDLCRGELENVFLQIIVPPLLMSLLCKRGLLSIGVV